jgi:hypothetical protein
MRFFGHYVLIEKTVTYTYNPDYEQFSWFFFLCTLYIGDLKIGYNYFVFAHTLHTENELKGKTKTGTGKY